MNDDLRDRLAVALGDGYRLERELGGGMSLVFVAHEVALDRRVVVKVLSPDLRGGLNAERFAQEIMLAARLQHPHLVPVLTAGELDGLPYYIMPLVDGSSLRERLERDRTLRPAEVVPILRDIARGLQHAHAAGVIHRDVKPENILLAGGSAVLTDLGVAKALTSAAGTAGSSGAVTAIGFTLGTPAYMSPEQAAADPALDARSDLYALGVVAYEMLVGSAPFRGTSQELLAAHLTTPPPALPRGRVPPGLAAVVLRCLAKRPEDRFASAADLLTALDAPDLLESSPLARVPRWAALALGALAVAVAAGLALGGRREAGAGFKSVAVLPIVNLGGNPENEYFADGLTDELTVALATVPGLRVASRTSAFKYKGSDVTAQEIGEALRVTTVLEGTLRRQGSRLRYSAQLIGVEDGLALWAGTYEREASDVFALQDDMAQAILGALGASLGGGTGKTRRGTRDLGAYDLFLRGRFFLAKRNGDALNTAVEQFRRALARDPAFARAHAGLADAYALLPLYTTFPADSSLALAVQSASRAVELDTTLAEAYAARGNLFNGAWRWREAERDLRRAIALDPAYPTAHQWLGETLLLNGRVEEAVAALGRAAELDPLSPVVSASYALALAVARQPTEALARARSAVELDPATPVTQFMLGAVRLYAGEPDSALPALEAADRLLPTYPPVLGLLGYAHARAGRRAEAERYAEAIRVAGSPGNEAGALARVYLGLGEIEEALDWMERGVGRRDTFFGSESLASPIFDPLRSEPRFRAIVERVGLDAVRLTARATDRR